MESSAKVEEVLLLLEEVTESSVLSPARETVVLSVRKVLRDIRAVEVPCWLLVSGLSWGRPSSAGNAQGHDGSHDTEWGRPEIRLV